MERAYHVSARKVCEYLKKDEGVQHRYLRIVQDGYKQDRRGWAQERLSSTQDTVTRGQQCTTHSRSYRYDVEKASKSLIGWEPVSARQMVARFRTSHKRITLAESMCYAPQIMQRKKRLRSSMIGWEPHCVRVQKRRSWWWWETSMLKQEMTTLATRQQWGDTEQKRSTEGCSKFKGPETRQVGGHVWEWITLSGSLCREQLGYRSDAISTQHITTLVSPDQRTHNQINHICIGQKFRRSIFPDVRVKRGADAASDHHLVIWKLELIHCKGLLRWIICKKRSTTQWKGDVRRSRKPLWKLWRRVLERRKGSINRG